MVMPKQSIQPRQCKFSEFVMCARDPFVPCSLQRPVCPVHLEALSGKYGSIQKLAERVGAMCSRL
jgi:hypothetical protein